MTGRLVSPLAAKTAALTFVLTVLLGSSSGSSQFRDRLPPTAPTNLVVTAFSSYSVSLSWSPSTDNSGAFSYRLSASSGTTMTLGKAVTSATVSAGLSAQQSYTFYLYAVDAAGNRSKNSNKVTVTLPADTTAPVAPVLSATSVSASTVSLSWTPAVDDGPYVSYEILVGGGPAIWAGGATSMTIPGLAPSTTYTFAVHGRDNFQNWSPLSNLLNVTTAPSNPNDTTPPTPPADLWGMDFECAEEWLFWTPSTDNSDPSSAIKYDVFVNGRLDHTVFGRSWTILYGDEDGPNTFTVVAVDVAGNRSTPASRAAMLYPCR